MIARNSLFDRRKRVNCESLLAIGTGQSIPVNNPNLNVSLLDYTVSMVVEGSGTISKGSWQVSISNVSLMHLTLTTSQVYDNAEPFDSNSRSWDAIGDLVIGAGFKIQHLKIASRSWIQSEIDADHRQPGYAPKSTHESILAHYVADREGLYFWDVVEQYNYAKPAPAYGSDGSYVLDTQKQLINDGDYLEFELVSVPIATAQFYRIGLYTYLPGGEEDVSQDGTIAVTQTNSQTIQIYEKGAYVGAIGSNQTGYRIRFYKQGNTIVITRIDTSGTETTARTETVSDVGNYYPCLQLLGQTPLVANVNVNGTPVVWNYLRKAKIDDASGLPYKSNSLDPHHATLQNFTPQQVDTEAGTQDAYLDFYDKTILRPFVDSDNDGTPDQPLTEKASLLPPLVNALKFDAASNQYASVSNFVPTKEKGYTYLFATYAIPTNSLEKGIFSKRGTSGNRIVAVFNFPSAGDLFLVNRTSSSAQSATFPALLIGDLNNLHQFVITEQQGELSLYKDGRLVQTKPTWTLHSGFDMIDGDLYIATDDDYLTSRELDGMLIQLGIAKGIITPRQVIELWNNGLLANPKASWRNLEWQLYPNWNQIIDDGSGNYSVADNSPQRYAIPLTGFTANNLDPNDPAYSSTPINDLR